MIGTTKTGQENVKPIVLDNIILYGMDGKPVHTYKRIELDGEAARGDDGEYLIKTQNECNEYFAACGDGRRLPALPELYAIMEHLHETKHPALDGIVNDLTESWLCTGTKIDYSTNEIIHPEFGAIKCPIPVGDHWLDEAVKSKPWENVLQALLMCKDAKKAVKVLHEAGRDRPYIWPPLAESRRSIPERAVWLLAYTGGFILLCGGYPIFGCGRFRGVQVEGATGAACEKNRA